MRFHHNYRYLWCRNEFHVGVVVVVVGGVVVVVVWWRNEFDVGAMIEAALNVITICQACTEREIH